MGRSRCLESSATVRTVPTQEGWVIQMADENGTIAERLEALEAENAHLRNALKEYNDEQEDFRSHKVFVTAQKRLIAWIRYSLYVVVFLTTVGGWLGYNEIKEYATTQVETILPTVLPEMVKTTVEAEVKMRIDPEIRDIVLSQRVTDQSVAAFRRAVKSENGEIATSICFNNRWSEAIAIYWINYDGQREFYLNLEPGEQYLQETYVSHPWVVLAKSDEIILASIVGTSQDQELIILDPTRSQVGTLMHNCAG